MSMHFKKSLLASALVALFSASGVQAATPSDLARLGNELTPFGAEKAGNASGSIPAWNGGLTQAPNGWKPGHGDPYGADKPLYSMVHPWPSAAKPASCRFTHCAMPAFGHRGLTGRYNLKPKRGGLTADLTFMEVPDPCRSEHVESSHRRDGRQR